MLAPFYQHKTQMKKSLSSSAGYYLAEMPISKFRVPAEDGQAGLGHPKCIGRVNLSYSLDMPVIQSVGLFNIGLFTARSHGTVRVPTGTEGTYRSQSPFEPVATYLLSCVGRPDAPCSLGKMNVLRRMERGTDAYFVYC